KPEDRFLDIGCGWGGLIMWAAEHYGVDATGITLSQNQFDYVSQQIEHRGLAGKVTVKLMDYRDLPENEPFDKIASVGMFEHVGRKNLPIYFKKIYNLLVPGGLVMNHGITTTDTKRKGLGSDISDFVDEYVFPNGELVHISHVIEVMSNHGLECRDIESLRPHYAKTLWNWVERLEANKDEAVRLVNEERYRIWRIYMAGSAFSFEQNWISLFQVVAGRPFDNGELPYPLTRAHLYQ
ncbi:MAG: class I SAM-dependent methyltransferase, partial [Pseudomonadota bacterium]|nr:class I SAM-dependent methyltransferase [Pseudomonadota bacterium]